MQRNVCSLSTHTYTSINVYRHTAILAASKYCKNLRISCLFFLLFRVCFQSHGSRICRAYEIHAAKGVFTQSNQDERKMYFLVKFQYMRTKWQHERTSNNKQHRIIERTEIKRKKTKYPRKINQQTFENMIEFFIQWRRSIMNCILQSD